MHVEISLLFCSEWFATPNSQRWRIPPACRSLKRGCSNLTLTARWRNTHVKWLSTWYLCSCNDWQQWLAMTEWVGWVDMSHSTRNVSFCRRVCASSLANDVSVSIGSAPSRCWCYLHTTHDRCFIRSTRRLNGSASTRNFGSRGAPETCSTSFQLINVWTNKT